jgi:membrane protein YdbS with pleckstrin-like domain
MVSVVTDASSPTYSEEIPTLAVVFVGATITVLILVAALIVANTLRRRITIKQEYSQDEMQIKNIQVFFNRNAKTPRT